MSTKNKLPIEQIGASNSGCYSRVRSAIEAAFFGNNVIKVETLAQAYELAKNCPGTIITDLPVVRAEELGLPKDAKVLLFNDGKITGRQARLRRLVDDSNRAKYGDIVREMTYKGRNLKWYHAEAYVGLDKDFMVKAHLLVPEGFENTLYSWILNFQTVDEEYTKLYNESKPIDEGDIYIYSNPGMTHEEFPDGLALFDDKNNCACLLGMRYFGEHKKGTLTLAWSCAGRQGYTACHGGQKRFTFKDGHEKVISVFGLSGSGKSTITLAEPKGDSSVTVLHDDAFIISNKDGSSVRLEQSYFDKTADYPLTRDQSKYFLTIQNCGATLDNLGRVVPVTEDCYANNGRTVKSKFAAENSEHKFSKATDAIFWIMKDPTFPPVIKVNSPALASAMGATLATKRSSAEYIPGVDPNALVIVPYANPFRLYPLSEDFNKFKDLFDQRHIECYIINTGSFMDKKVSKEITLESIETIVKEEARFVPFGPLSELEYMPVEGFEPNFEDSEYLKEVKARLQDRLDYVNKLEGNEKLPDEAINAIKKVIDEVK